jgi:predicted outer membrane protein
MSAFRAENQLRLVLLLAIAAAGCGHDGARHAERGPAVADLGVSRRANEAGGEVASDSAKPALHWLDDANAVALVNLMNGRQLAAADAELSSWHVDTVRAFAAEMSREHSAMQRSIDSIAEALKLVPVTPALAPLVRARMQMQIDSMWQHAGRGFDRAYLDQAVSSHQLMLLYLSRLSAAAESPALQQVLAVASDSVQSQLKRATALRTAFAVADSAAADSAARRAARRAARLKGESGR